MSIVLPPNKGRFFHACSRPLFLPQLESLSATLMLPLELAQTPKGHSPNKTVLPSDASRTSGVPRPPKLLTYRPQIGGFPRTSLGSTVQLTKLGRVLSLLLQCYYKVYTGTSLVAQWLRIRLPTQGTQVRWGTSGPGGSHMPRSS